VLTLDPLPVTNVFRCFEIKAAREKDTRRCFLLLGAILETPGLADRLLEALQPERGGSRLHGKEGRRRL